MNELFRRIRYLLNRERFDRELAGDMEAHREMAGREGRGAAFGNPLRLREEAREAWGWTWIDRFFQDLRFAARMLRKSPGFTLAAVLMLAIGVGANVAAFSFFDLMVLRPLAIRDPGTLLRFERSSPQGYAMVLPYPEMEFFREHSRTLSAVVALNNTKVAIEGEAKQILAHFVTANYFREIGGAPKLGRVFDPARDGVPGAEPVVVLSERFWRRHFGGDPSAVGKTIRVNGKRATAIGVVPAEFNGLSMGDSDVWIPIAQQPFFVDGSRLLTAFSGGDDAVQMWGRLQPGLTAKVAEGELGSLAAEMRKQYPNDIWKSESLPSRPGGYAENLNDGTSRGSGPKRRDEMFPILVTMGALVLSILAAACGNLGSMLLARGVAREREMWIRAAVGAGRGRLIRQLFTESLLLALLGSAAGLAVGYVVLRGLLALTTAPAWLDPTPDWRVVAFAAGMGFVAAILFGLTPAFQVARPRHRATKARQALIGAQVAASCVSLIVAGLLARALDRATRAHPGFEFEQVVSIDPALWAHGYSPENARAYLEALKSRLHGVPGVDSVSFASVPPLGHRTVVFSSDDNGRSLTVHVNHIDPEYFATMKIPLLRGRNLTRGETGAIVVSESLARLEWPAEDPLGKPFPVDNEKFTVVGVAGNARVTAPQDSDAQEGYYVAGAADMPSMTVLVKTSGPPEGLVPFVASIAKTIDPKVFPEVELLRTSFRERLHGAEYSALAVGALGGMALLLACLGIVGLVSYAVSQRTKEIGIRMALGAKPMRVLSAVLRQFALPVAVGLAVGVGGAAALSRILRRQLYGVSHLDPVAYLAAIGVFAITAGVAALLPARRALKIDPLRALRYE